MTAEEADAETPVMSAEAADAETPEPATPEPATTTPATLDALQNYLGPLCQALLGATPEALRRADASNIEWFAGQPAGSTLVCTTDENGAVAYHRGRSRSGASRYVVIASTAPLGPTISEGGLAADALSIVLSGTSADPINEAKGVVRAALAPLVAEVEDETSNVAAVKRRLGELESALSRCGHKGDAALVSLPLTPPPKIADLLSHMKSDEVADQVGEDSAVADRCAESVAAWAASTVPWPSSSSRRLMRATPCTSRPRRRAATPCTPKWSGGAPIQLPLTMLRRRGRVHLQSRSVPSSRETGGSWLLPN